MYNRTVDVMSKDPSNRSLEQLLLDQQRRYVDQKDFRCFVQLPKFNTNVVLFIKDNEITLSANGLRWTLYVNEIQTFTRYA